MFQSLDLVTSLFINIISTSSWWSLVQGHGHTSRKGCQSVCLIRPLTIECIDLETLCWLDRHIKVMWSTSRSCDQCQRHAINIKVMWSMVMWSMSSSCDQCQAQVISVKVMWSMSRSCDQRQGHVINAHVINIEVMWSTSRSHRFN